MPNIKTIKASVRIAPKIKDTYYSIEYSEERELIGDEQLNIEDERNALFDDVYNTVVQQINEIAQS